MSVTKGLLVRFDALPGKEDDVKDFLDSGRALVVEEPATTAWFAIRLGPSSFGIFDVFPDDARRDAHLSGPVAVALGEQTGAGALFSEPTIEKLDVLSSKLPA
ncbi:antibiotic biosynthesis monooxygenase [Micrococcus sp. ACRRV]|uniref:putative quinol monooxygenase n=1 Tax=Micrococcus sp. ACRRV TaxID=2918203 RepID=UPI001EF2954E|nr:antibiotic biosynthesis monooxygenase [Micrococcus sp. ACRRV]MCG7421857.1 antibiotic biosynthesis monooxygenase [Micrococcus sp. ACRRV]